MKYLSEFEIVSTNVCIQQTYGQVASIRDQQALDDIVSSASQVVFGRRLYETEIDVAVFYFVKLVKKHVFNDCNKRTAYICLLDCLTLNQIDFHPNPQQRMALNDLAVYVAQVDAEPQALWNHVNHVIKGMLVNDA